MLRLCKSHPSQHCFDVIMATHSYSTIADASQGLLVETCYNLNRIELDYAVAGGWVPVLRSRHALLSHPGTKDVDILFGEDRSLLRECVSGLISAGYIISAKHEFQLLRQLQVGGKPMVFNIDLMHPGEAVAQPELFMDIMDLRIYENYDTARTLMMKSICFPSSKIMFDLQMFSRIRLDATRPNGEHERVRVPLLNESAAILSKCLSVKQAKRRRDAFDIFYILTAEGGQAVSQKLRKLGSTYPQVEEQLGELREFLENSGNVFDANVNVYIGNPQGWPERPSQVVHRCLFGG